MTTLKLVILDRDGTINADSDDFVKSPEEWLPLPGALEAIAGLNHAGWHVAIASNQSGLGRGLFDVAALNAIHTKMHKLLAAVGGRVDAVFYCPHSPEEVCVCRKPLPGLFEQIGLRFGVSLKGVPACGDSLRDVVAARAAGCEAHLVLSGKSAAFASTAGLTAPAGSQPTGLPGFPEVPKGTLIHRDLAAFAAFLIDREAAVHAAHTAQAAHPFQAPGPG